MLRLPHLLFFASLVRGDLVRTISMSNFASEVVPHEWSLVSFGSESCPTCISLHPHLLSVAHKLQDRVAVGVAYEEDDEGGELFEYFHIHDYPTVLLLRFGRKLEVYEGPLDTWPLVVFAERQILPPISHAHSLDQLQSLLSASHDAVVTSVILRTQPRNQACTEGSSRSSCKYVHLINDLSMKFEYDEYTFVLYFDEQFVDIGPALLVSSCANLVSQCFQINGAPLCCSGSMTADELEGILSQGSGAEKGPAESEELSKNSGEAVSGKKQTAVFFLGEWLTQHDVPAIGPMVSMNALLYLRKLHPIAFLYLPLPLALHDCLHKDIEDFSLCTTERNAHVEDTHGNLLAYATSVAQENRKLSFAWVSAKEHPDPKKSGVVSFEIVDYEKSARYIYDGTVTIFASNSDSSHNDPLRVFIAGVADGKVPPYNPDANVLLLSVIAAAAAFKGVLVVGLFYRLGSIRTLLPVALAISVGGFQACHRKFSSTSDYYHLPLPSLVSSSFLSWLTAPVMSLEAVSRLFATTPAPTTTDATPIAPTSTTFAAAATIATGLAVLLGLHKLHRKFGKELVSWLAPLVVYVSPVLLHQISNTEGGGCCAC